MNKCKFEVGIDFVILIAVLYLLDTKNILIFGLFAAVIHEIGHILAVWMCGGYIENIQISAFGANIELTAYPMLSYQREIVIAIGGPLLGLLSAIVFASIGGEACYILAGLNLILTVFNLLPAYPLDGGRVLKYVGLLFLREDYVVILCMIGNIISALIMLVLCLFVNLKLGFSLSLTVFSLFIATSLVNSARKKML